VAGATQNTALFCHEREQVARSRKVVRFARRVADCLDGSRSLRGRDAGARGTMIDWYRITGAERRRVRLDHRVQVEMLADLRQNRHAQLAAAVRNHEVDRIRRRLLGGTNEVAFVLAVLGIDDNNDPPSANRVDSLFNSGKSVAHGTSSS
jgi:hypothetical protein